MKSAKLAETNLYSLEMNSQLSLVYLVLKKHASDGELRETILRTIDIAQKHHLKHIMINSQRMDYVDINDQHWIATEFAHLVAMLPDCQWGPGCKIIGILPEEATRLLAGYTVVEKAQEFLKEKQGVEIVIFTDVNTALLSIEPNKAVR